LRLARGVTQVVVGILAELLLASLATVIVVDTRVMMLVRTGHGDFHTAHRVGQFRVVGVITVFLHRNNSCLEVFAKSIGVACHVRRHCKLCINYRIKCLFVRSLVDQRNGSFSPNNVSAEGSEDFRQAKRNPP
jgi:hypothetical protein